MNGQRITAYLNSDEWRLIQALRQVPSGSLHERLWELLVELADFARDPACAELQADGVPCDNAQRDCSQCREVVDLIERLYAGLRTRTSV